MKKLKYKVQGSLKSRTIWFGAAVMAVTWLENNSDIVANMVPDEYSGLVGYAVGIAIWFFRYATVKPLEEKAPEIVKDKEMQIALDKWKETLATNPLEEMAPEKIEKRGQTATDKLNEALETNSLKDY